MLYLSNPFIKILLSIGRTHLNWRRQFLSNRVYLRSSVLTVEAHSKLGEAVLDCFLVNVTFVHNLYCSCLFSCENLRRNGLPKWYKKFYVTPGNPGMSICQSLTNSSTFGLKYFNIDWNLSCNWDIVVKTKVNAFVHKRYTFYNTLISRIQFNNCD